jgi:hypothetical protein
MLEAPRCRPKPCDSAWLQHWRSRVDLRGLRFPSFAIDFEAPDSGFEASRIDFQASRIDFEGFAMCFRAPRIGSKLRRSTSEDRRSASKHPRLVGRFADSVSSSRVAFKAFQVDLQAPQDRSKLWDSSPKLRQPLSEVPPANLNVSGAVLRLQSGNRLHFLPKHGSPLRRKVDWLACGWRDPAHRITRERFLATPRPPGRCPSRPHGCRLERHPRGLCVGQSPKGVPLRFAGADSIGN